ncbi:MAG: F0F1 ATP synthase subunit A [Clostridium argentinense]|uniref:ATP synthase subunit a n=1 Tax=Clostridium faecium TaxID=2762223 RepID=A0ABR8YU05_9CLOT|nr:MULTISPECIES: F0F1 ATP synthase subunit A [Clostridium]MBD8047622.1 F0F1 ATP synthase subunit A [Clostridium faecium]MBS5823259.1 F0F1 ATP synthase subunit A [Clostridium argentinense]MDU1349647.1 F0F1 ATP synthase subunit A [Clostridium argentinense]
MEEVLPIFTLNIFGFPFNITLSLIIQWFIIGIAAILSILYSKTVKRIPGKIQSAIEIIIGKLNGIVGENMGKDKLMFVPYIGALAIYIFSLNMVGMFGLKAPTSELSVTIGIALTTFLVIQGYAIKKLGLKGYFKGYASPVALLLPINILDRIMLPVSLSLRLFGNVFAATMVMELIYSALGKIHFIATIGIPVPFAFYFDFFDGIIQTVIFVMLTMIHIKLTAEH